MHMDVSEAVAHSMAVRAFRPDAVSGNVVRGILTAACRAPSGGNLQPWKIYALGGDDIALRNFDFFGAPVGIFFCMDRRLGPTQWADMGMLMQTVMLLAVEQGIDTCPQEIWARWPKIVSQYLRLPYDHMVFAGMSMGFGDPDHPLNQLKTRREPFDVVAQMSGF